MRLPVDSTVDFIGADPRRAVDLDLPQCENRREDRRQDDDDQTRHRAQYQCNRDASVSGTSGEPTHLGTLVLATRPRRTAKLCPRRGVGSGLLARARHRGGRRWCRRPCWPRGLDLRRVGRARRAHPRRLGRLTSRRRRLRPPRRVETLGSFHAGVATPPALSGVDAREASSCGTIRYTSPQLRVMMMSPSRASSAARSDACCQSGRKSTLLASAKRPETSAPVTPGTGSSRAPNTSSTIGVIG